MSRRIKVSIEAPTGKISYYERERERERERGLSGANTIDHAGAECNFSKYYMDDVFPFSG